MAVERRLDDAALNAAATPVHEANLDQSGGDGGRDELVDHRFDVARCKGVQIQFTLDRNLEGQSTNSEFLILNSVVTVSDKKP
jgi:hypothetical protein